jgi:ribosomal protein S18 acetylase RimI-like enzyme
MAHVQQRVSAADIRLARLSDVPALIDIDDYAAGHPERRLFIASAVKLGECFIAEVGPEIAGFMIVNQGFFGFGFIPLVVVASRHRRQGIALRLLAQAKLLCKSSKLFTSANQSNRTAQALFARAGFRRSGAVENLDQDDPEIIFFTRATGADREGTS